MYLFVFRIVPMVWYFLYFSLYYFQLFLLTYSFLLIYFSNIHRVKHAILNDCVLDLKLLTCGNPTLTPKWADEKLLRHAFERFLVVLSGSPIEQPNSHHHQYISFTHFSLHSLFLFNLHILMQEISIYIHALSNTVVAYCI